MIVHQALKKGSAIQRILHFFTFMMQMAYLINQLMVISIHFQANYLKGKNHQTLRLSQRFSVFCIFLPLVMLSFHQAHFPLSLNQ
jgi:uncharacterized membrane protein YhdT